MFRTLLQHLRGNDIAALDGRIGVLDDLALHAERWAVAYLVVDTGRWGSGPLVLVSPRALTPERSSADAIAVALTREQVRTSPPARLRLSHPGRGFWEGHVRLDETVAHFAGVFGAHPLDQAGLPPLHGARELAGCAVLACDGAYGRVTDLLVNEREWTLPGVLVDTHRWYPRKKLLVRRSAIERIDWSARALHVRFTRSEMAGFPAAA